MIQDEGCCFMRKDAPQIPSGPVVLTLLSVQQ